MPMPSDKDDCGGKPTKNRMSKNATQPLPGGPTQKPGQRLTDEPLR